MKNIGLLSALASGMAMPSMRLNSKPAYPPPRRRTGVASMKRKAKKHRSK